jgi:hypothetical protein
MTILGFNLMALYENVHPLEGGALRLKFRRDRRSGLPLENPFLFYPRYIFETVFKIWQYAMAYLRCMAILDQALYAPDRFTYSDIAISPLQKHDIENLDLYHATSGGEEALLRMHREEAIREHIVANHDGASTSAMTDPKLATHGA